VVIAEFIASIGRKNKSKFYIHVLIDLVYYHNIIIMWWIMSKNLSLSQGVPASRSAALGQHQKLADLLKNNELFSVRFQNRGYLSLENATGKFKGCGFFNILYSTKPSKAGIIKLTKV
jgi:hypothetical protein